VPVQSSPRGPRSTWQRRAVLRALADAPGFVSARALHTRLHAQGQRVGVATVYRTLRAFAHHGHVAITQDGTGRHLYRLQGEHGRFLVCRRCGHAVNVNAAVVEQWATATAKHFEFSDIQTVIELTGVCRSCPPAHGPALNASQCSS
jgi:Fur family transcriptional regulator, ferric uptake regulator